MKVELNREGNGRNYGKLASWSRFSSTKWEKRLLDAIVLDPASLGILASRRSTCDSIYIGITHRMTSGMTTSLHPVIYVHAS